MALNIRINDDWKLTSDAFNVILHRRIFVDPTKSPNWEEKEAEGASPEIREDWETVGYYTTVERALDAVVDKTAKYSDAESFAELRNEMRQIRRDIQRVLT